MELSDFEVQERIGHGGQAITWRALHKPSGQIVALKELRLGDVDDWKSVELFEREAEILKSIQHRDIPDYIGSFSQEKDGTLSLYLAQEFVDGHNLTQEMARKGRWALDKLTLDAVGLLEVLVYLHNRVPPLIHRDIKPSNIIRRPDGRLCLVDFGAAGLAKRQGGGSTVIGTPGYMPLEQMLGQAEPRSDLYSLGMTLGHLLTGVDPTALPLKDNRVDFASALGGQPRSRMLSLIEYLTAPDRNHRPPSAQAALRLLRTGDGLQTSPKTPPTNASTPDAGPMGTVRKAITAAVNFFRPEGTPQSGLGEPIEAELLVGRFAPVRDAITTARRPPGSYWKGLRSKRPLVVDRPRYKSEQEQGWNQQTQQAHFEFVSKQTRFKGTSHQTTSMWRSTDGLLYLLIDEEPVNDGETASKTVLAFFEDGTRTAINENFSDALDGQDWELKGSGLLLKDQRHLREHLHDSGQGRSLIKGLNQDQVMALYRPNWFQIEEPFFVSESEPEIIPHTPSDMLQQEPHKDWLVSAAEILLLCLIIPFALLIAPFFLLFLPFLMLIDNDAWKHLLAWRAWRREQRAGHTPAFIPMPGDDLILAPPTAEERAALAQERVQETTAAPAHQRR